MESISEVRERWGHDFPKLRKMDFGKADDKVKVSTR